MKKSRVKRFFEKRAVFLILALCLLSAAGMYGMYRMEINKAEDTELETARGLVDLNEPADEAASRIQITGRSDSEAADKAAANQEQNALQAAGAETAAAAEAVEMAGAGAIAVENGEAQENEVQTAAGAAALSFSGKQKIKWPVKGNIILDFSPENTIYFATLDQYRCNPAIFIQAATGTQVISCAKGVVTAISENEEYGTMVTVDLGSGYEAIYGQLENVQVKKDQTVLAGDAIGNVSTPSKYFGVEGSHLYFQLLKDEEPVNPRAYLE